MVMPTVNRYLGDTRRKSRSFARRRWLFLAGLAWALGTAGQVIACNVDTSPELMTRLKPNCSVGELLVSDMHH